MTGVPYRFRSHPRARNGSRHWRAAQGIDESLGLLLEDGAERQRHALTLLAEGDAHDRHPARLVLTQRELTDRHGAGDLLARPAQERRLRDEDEAPVGEHNVVRTTDA